MKKYAVPEGMLKAAYGATTGLGGRLSTSDCMAIIEAAIEWISENPIVPTPDQIEEMVKYHRDNVSLWNSFGSSSNPIYYCSEWQRRMFIITEPEVPEVIRNLYDSSNSSMWKSAILYAYRAGKESK